MKYKLNILRDIDTDEPGVFILNLPGGYQFTHDAYELSHTRAYDSMKELKDDIKHYVAECNCKECLSMLGK